MKKNIIPIFLTFIICISMALIGFFIGCKTLKVIEIEGQPQPCNDMYTVMGYNLKNKIKDQAILTLFIAECQSARKFKLNKDCEKWIYQGQDIKKSDYKKRSYLLECSKK